MIGVGSFLFHTFATGWALAADVIPIIVFILAYLFLAVRHYLGAPLWASVLIAFAYIPVSALVVPVFEPIIGSSAGYAPAWMAIFIVGLLMLGRDRQVAIGLIITAGVFLASIIFRTIDGPICAHAPIGTHFIWHIFNGIVLYRLAVIFMRQQDRVAT